MAAGQFYSKYWILFQRIHPAGPIQQVRRYYVIIRCRLPGVHFPVVAQLFWKLFVIAAPSPDVALYGAAHGLGPHAAITNIFPMVINVVCGAVATSVVFMVA